MCERILEEGAGWLPPGQADLFLVKQGYMKQTHDPPSLSLKIQTHLQGVASIFHSDITDGLDTPVQAVSRRGPQGSEVCDLQFPGERPE